MIRVPGNTIYVNSADGSGASSIALPAFELRNGAAVLGGVKHEGDTGSTITVTDTAGNVYEVATARIGSGGDLKVTTFACRNARGHPANVITISFGLSVVWVGAGAMQAVSNRPFLPPRFDSGTVASAGPVTVSSPFGVRGPAIGFVVLGEYTGTSWTTSDAGASAISDAGANTDTGFFFRLLGGGTWYPNGTAGGGSQTAIAAVLLEEDTEEDNFAAAAGGGGGVTGSLTKDQAADSLTASATIPSTAALNASQAGNTLSAAAVVPSVAALSATQAANTLSGAATTPSVANLNATQASDTLTADATISSGVTSSLSATQDAQTLSGAATVPSTAAASITQADQTLSGAATTPVTAAASLTEAADTLSASAAIAGAVTATLTATQADNTLDARGAGPPQQTGGGSIADPYVADQLGLSPEAARALRERINRSRSKESNLPDEPKAEEKPESPPEVSRPPRQRSRDAADATADRIQVEQEARTAALAITALERQQAQAKAAEQLQREQEAAAEIERLTAIAVANDIALDDEEAMDALRVLLAAGVL